MRTVITLTEQYPSVIIKSAFSFIKYFKQLDQNFSLTSRFDPETLILQLFLEY